MDTIFIQNLVYTGTHGVHPEEHYTPQRFSIDVRMDVETEIPSLSDKIEDTVDYQNTRDLIRSVIEGEHCHLIEKLGQRIASSILGNPRVHSCEIAIKKLDLWGNGTPGIKIQRARVAHEKTPFLINVPLLVECLDRDGACSLPLLNRELCEKMTVEAEKYSTDFKTAESEYGKNKVKQRFVYFRGYPKESLLWKISKDLSETLNDGIRKLPQLPFESPITFTEVSAQRYEKGELGITPHRDEKFYRNIVVVCVVDGEGDFYLTTDRVSGIETSIPAKVGDVIFMKAPGFKDCNRGPLHAVRNISSRRLSITYRQEENPGFSKVANK